MKSAFLSIIFAALTIGALAQKISASFPGGQKALTKFLDSVRTKINQHITFSDPNK